MLPPPIFIGGLERTGTSLMRALVGSHPDVALFPRDLPLWTRFFPRYRNADLRKPGAVASLLGAIAAHERYRAAGLDLDLARVEARARGQPGLDCAVVFRCLLEAYAATLGRPRWGLKTPGNERHAEDIFRAHPDARMVHMIRDPRDVAVSLEASEWGGWRFDPEAHVVRWKTSLQLSRANARRFAGSYLPVRYEDLVHDTEATLRTVCAALRLDYDPVMLAMAGQRDWEGSNSSFGAPRAPAANATPGAPIDAGSVGRYRTRLGRRELWRLQSSLADELRLGAYALEPLPPPSRAERLAFAVQGHALQLRSRTVGALAALLRPTPLHDPLRTLYRSLLGRGRPGRPA